MPVAPGLRARSLLCVMAAASLLSVQTGAQTPEVTTKETPVTFTSATSLVPVTVVVRDSQGHAVGNLGLEDFQLFDNNKPQMISKFSVESILKESAPPQQNASGPVSSAPAAVPPDTSSEGIPNRFVAYLFDDLHLSLGELVNTREAARRELDATLQPLTRAAIYTTSGSPAQEFTSDPTKLRAALNAIGATHVAQNNSLKTNTCPPVDYYSGDRIYNKHDLNIWKIAVDDALYFCPPSGYPAVGQPSTITECEISGSTDGYCKAVRDAKFAARAAVEAGDRDTSSTLEALRAVVNRLAAIPGQRNIVLISPGFLVLDGDHEKETGLVNRAIKANVIIGGLDARGLYSQSPGGDASTRVNNKTIAEKAIYQSMAATIQTDVVANLADGTGGTFYHGANDFAEGLARVAAVPDYMYVLGFSPQDLKLDGKFHTLKVTLRNAHGTDPRRLDLQVRKGYYAPNTSGDPADQAHQQISEAVFSRSEVHGLPAILQTQYFKTDDGDATLTAVTKIDVKKLSFHKEGDRNRNDVTVVTSLFDNDGNYISGGQKILEMRFLDETLEKRAAGGISVKNNFTVHPGRYVVRLVVRDSESKLMSAQSSLVEIP